MENFSFHFPRSLLKRLYCRIQKAENMAGNLVPCPFPNCLLGKIDGGLIAVRTPHPPPTPPTGKSAPHRCTFSCDQPFFALSREGPGGGWLGGLPRCTFPADAFSGMMNSRTFFLYFSIGRHARGTCTRFRAKKNMFNPNSLQISRLNSTKRLKISRSFFFTQTTQFDSGGDRTSKNAVGRKAGTVCGT